MSRIPKREWYRRVNETWPDIVPPLTRDEAARAARRLYRFVVGRKFTGKVVQSTGNRYPKVWGGRMVINPEHPTQGGWKGLVHMLSHYLAPGTGHGGEHARLERRMINQVLGRGWLDGALRREPKAGPAPEALRVEKLRKVAASILRWERKLGRAQRALAKLRRKLKREQSRTAPTTLVAKATGDMKP